MKITRLLFFSVVHCAGLSAISMVYNFRIAQITKQPVFEAHDARNHSFIALVFDQYQRKYDGSHQNYAGGLGSFIYEFTTNYFRADFAVSHIQETVHHRTTFCGTETDDLLFTLGHNFIINSNAALTLSGLFGVPTHKIFRLRHPDFGSGQVGLGIQLDGVYTLNQRSALLYGGRYIYFVPRNARDEFGRNHTYTIGSTGDLLFAYKHTWTKSGLEFGYTARSQFEAQIYPDLDDIVKRTNYVRSNFYCVYKYKFLMHNLANRVLFNIACGHDHRPKKFGNKFIITLWAAWNIRF